MEFEKRILPTHATDYDPDRRYDLIILANQDSFRLPPNMARAMILNFATEQWMKPQDEAIDHDWVEVYSAPGPSAHTMFTRSSFDTKLTVFEEGAIYFGQEPAFVEYAGRLRVFFYIEFRGCLFKTLHGDFNNRLASAFSLKRARVLSRPAQPLPPHRVPSDAEEED